jgi:2-Cys peroxiredoxin 5
VKVGDAIPNLDVLTEGSPANKVNLAKELSTGHGIIIGVPGAYSRCYLPSLDFDTLD